MIPHFWFQKNMKIWNFASFYNTECTVHIWLHKSRFLKQATKESFVGCTCVPLLILFNELYGHSDNELLFVFSIFSWFLWCFEKNVGVTISAWLVDLVTFSCFNSDRKILVSNFSHATTTTQFEDQLWILMPKITFSEFTFFVIFAFFEFLL